MLGALVEASAVALVVAVPEEAERARVSGLSNSTTINDIPPEDDMATVTKRKNSKYWVARFTDKRGRRRQKSTKTTDQTRALEIADEYERRENGMRNYKNGLVSVATIVSTASLWYFALPFGTGYMFFGSVIVAAVFVVFADDAITLLFGDGPWLSSYRSLWEIASKDKSTKDVFHKKKRSILQGVAAVLMTVGLILYEASNFKIMSGLLCLVAAILLILTNDEQDAKTRSIAGGIGGGSGAGGASAGGAGGGAG